MKASELKDIRPALSVVEDKVGALFESEKFVAVKNAIKDLSEALPETMSLSLNVEIDIYDRERDAEVRLSQLSIAAGHGIEPYECSGDSEFQRYIVEGEICEVPSDYCPKCWGEWGFKEDHRECPSCGVELGNEITILLDSDKCPHCGIGKVGIDHPKCSECEHEVDLTIVTWG